MRFWGALYSIAVTAWVGSLLAIGYLAAPMLFAQFADRAVAGIGRRHVFAVAWVGSPAALICCCTCCWSKAGARPVGVFWIVLLMLGLTAGRPLWRAADPGAAQGRRAAAAGHGKRIARPLCHLARGIERACTWCKPCWGSPWWCCRSGAGAASALRLRASRARRPVSWFAGLAGRRRAGADSGPARPSGAGRHSTSRLPMC
jgi:hypothetical protein